jgi:hypothetical protein
LSLWNLSEGLLQGTSHPGDSFFEAYDLILNLRFDESQLLLEQQVKSSEDKDFVYFLENLREFIEVMISEEPERYEKYRSDFQTRMNNLKETGNHDSPYFLYHQAEMHMHSFFSGYKFQDTWKAAVHFYSAYRLMNENNSLFPDFIPNMKVRGIQNIILGAIPDNYKWMVRIMGLKGNERDGITQLNEYLEFTKKSDFPELEAIMILAQFYIQNSSSDETAWEFIQTIQPAPLENPLFRFTYILTLNKAGRNNEVIQLIDKYPQGNNEFPFHFLNLLYGEAKLNRLDRDANIFLEKYLDQFEGLHYVKSAWQKLSWHYLLRGELNSYFSCRDNVISEGSSLTDADKEALFEVLIDTIPNPVLLSARLLFDGGYYQIALDTLLRNRDAKSFIRPKEKLEYFYRLGRVFHKLNDLTKARKYYMIVIRTGKEIPVYYASNSALQMGKIYEEEGDIKQARHYYQLAFDYRNGPYKNSIGYKARVALQNLKRAEVR